MLPYYLSFRVVRFKHTQDTYEVLLTNLPEDEFSVSELKELYAMRWGIETSFRDLKYSSCFVLFPL
jgi:IS4 transposase